MTSDIDRPYKFCIKPIIDVQLTYAAIYRPPTRLSRLLLPAPRPPRRNPPPPLARRSPSTCPPQHTSYPHPRPPGQVYVCYVHVMNRLCQLTTHPVACSCSPRHIPQRPGSVCRVVCAMAITVHYTGLRRIVISCLFQTFTVRACVSMLEKNN